MFRPATASWYVQGQPSVQWGSSGDVPAPADYDGDGKADIAVFRPSTGQWFVRSSVTGAGIVTLWGRSGDVPVPSDYASDGKADIGVFRPSTGAWFIQGQPGGVWGYSTDIPLPCPRPSGWPSTPASPRRALRRSSAGVDRDTGQGLVGHVEL